MKILVKVLRRSAVQRLALGVVVITIVVRAAAGQTYPVNSRGSYIFVNTAGTTGGLPDVAVPPLVVDLASIRVMPGDTITMSSLGDFSYS